MTTVVASLDRASPAGDAVRPVRRSMSWSTVVLMSCLLGGPVSAEPQGEPRSISSTDTVTLSIVGTTDLHGQVFDRDEHGGVALLGGYLRNLRAARASDGGAVLLLDAGDTFEGGIESNLSEGALVVDAYNALGYDALAVGNHEFDYGARDADVSEPRDARDMRGALKAAAARARFPFLAANLVDETSGRPVSWPNVRPSTLIETAGLRVGVVGVMTYDALTKTLAANVQGLATTPLASSVETEAGRLRQRGAEVVVVVAHAGGWCGQFADPTDLSSCDDDAEIFQLARQLPPGLVDAIVAGHTHAAVAHEVAGIPIIQAYARGAAFGRLDLRVRPGAGVVSARIFEPQLLCIAHSSDGTCDPDGGRAPVYEGAVVEPGRSVAAAMRPELERVRRWRAAPLGVVLETPLPRHRHGLESPLGNLFADALLEAVPHADLAIGMGARRGGLRADLPAGPLTRGPLYDVFPFDNRVVTVSLTGTQLRQVLAGVAVDSRRGIPSISGIRVRVTCVGNRLDIDVERATGASVHAADMVVVATTDFVARRLRVGPASLPPATALAAAPLVREAATLWLEARGRKLRAADLTDPPRWNASAAGACLAAN